MRRKKNTVVRCNERRKMNEISNSDYYTVHEYVKLFTIAGNEEIP